MTTLEHTHEQRARVAYTSHGYENDYDVSRGDLIDFVTDADGQQWLAENVDFEPHVGELAGALIRLSLMDAEGMAGSDALVTVLRIAAEVRDAINDDACEHILDEQAAQSRADADEAAADDWEPPSNECWP